MKIAVVGATGATGAAVTLRALAQGDDVVAVVRDRSKMLRLLGGRAASDVRVSTAAVGQHEELVVALAGCDAVVSCIGPVRGQPNDVMSTAATWCLAAMDATGVRRLVVISGSGHVVDGDDPITRYLAKPVVRLVLRDVFADFSALERIVSTSTVDWTIVRPPRLTNGPARGRYRTRLDRNVRWGFSVRRQDLARAVLDTLQPAAATVGHVGRRRRLTPDHRRAVRRVGCWPELCRDQGEIAPSAGRGSTRTGSTGTGSTHRMIPTNLLCEGLGLGEAPSAAHQGLDPTIRGDYLPKVDPRFGGCIRGAVHEGGAQVKVNAIDRSKLAKTGQDYLDLLASDADWIVRSADDLRQMRAAGGNAHAKVADRDFDAFVDSLEFRKGGVCTGSYKPLMASLTISEIFDVYESFGMDRGLALETQEAKCVGGSCDFSFWSFCASNCS